MSFDPEKLARALCDSSSHINLLPHDEQRPCDYHRKRATDTLDALHRMKVREALDAVNHCHGHTLRRLAQS